VPKRSNGEGTVRQRPNGQWEARISYWDENDHLTRKSFYGKTATEARGKMRQALKRIEKGQPAVDSSSTLSAWVNQWTGTILDASDRKPATKSLYRTLATTHLQPAPFGALTLAEIKPRHIDTLIVRLRDGKGLSESTVRNTYTVLRWVLDGAVRDGLIAENPTHRVPRPTVGKREARHLSRTEAAELLRAASESRYHAALGLIAGTGLRRGEALALTWADVDLDKQILRVRGTLGRVASALLVTQPKTENSRRDVVLTPGMVTLLRKHRAAQNAERLRAGNQWLDSGHVFTTELGGPVDPRNLLRVFTVAARKAGLQGVGLHTLRHTAATTLLDNGVPLHVVSRILGHSSVSITGDIYGHVIDTTQRDAMATLSEALGF
jgi:integrase